MLRTRWLGTVPYREALAVQQALFDRGREDHLLLLEHPHVYTFGVRASMEHVLVPPASVGAELVRAQRGGDVTYHGPGQLVGYPILSLAGKHGQAHGMADTVSYVSTVQQVLIDAIDGELAIGRNVATETLIQLRAQWSYHPGSPSPGDLCIIRT